MTWRDKVTIKILLLVAQMIAGDKWAKEIQNLSNHIQFRTPEIEMVGATKIELHV